MPANVADMLICNKAVKVLQDGGEYQQLALLTAQNKKMPTSPGSVIFWGASIFQSTWGAAYIWADHKEGNQEQFLQMC